MGLSFLRGVFLCLLMAGTFIATRADDILFFGNSFTFAEGAPVIQKNGGVPQLVRLIAETKGRKPTISAVVAGGQNWSFHLEQPITEKELRSKPWDWVVLQDYSTRPTAAGEIVQFMKDGETFAERISATSPKAGIVLYETWARPEGGDFYKTKPGNALSGTDQMMGQIHDSYAKLRDDLAAKNPGREIRVAPVGTAFAQVRAQYPEIIVDASDRHHATMAGYYLAALVIEKTIYHDAAKGAPVEFYDGKLKIPADEAAKLQEIADKVCSGAK